MKTLSTTLNAVGIALDVAIAIMSVITIRYMKFDSPKLKHGHKEACE